MSDVLGRMTLAHSAFIRSGISEKVFGAYQVKGFVEFEKSAE